MGFLGEFNEENELLWKMDWAYHGLCENYYLLYLSEWGAKGFDLSLKGP